VAEARWQGNLPNNLEALPRQVRRAMYAACAFKAPQAEAHMKSYAPWTDRTGNARNGLKAKATTPGGGVHGNVMALVLFGSVPYQIYLETRWSGRYAIILPTVELFGPQVMDLLEKLILPDGAA